MDNYYKQKYPLLLLTPNFSKKKLPYIKSKGTNPNKALSFFWNWCLIPNSSVDSYGWLLAKYNEWLILNTVPSLSQISENLLGICKDIKWDPIYIQLQFTLNWCPLSFSILLSFGWGMNNSSSVTRLYKSHLISRFYKRGLCELT